MPKSYLYFLETLPNSIVGEWYNQDRDEWVILLQGDATLGYFDGSSIQLEAGDYVFIPAHQKHRVEYTSSEPPYIWLAVHANLHPKLLAGT